MREPEEDMVYFGFSIATKRGSSRGGLGDLIAQIEAAGITVHNLCVFVSGKKTKLFCVPVNPDEFRAFAKERKLRLTEKTAVRLAGEVPPVMSLLHRRAISGDVLPALSVSPQSGFVYLPVKRH